MFEAASVPELILATARDPAIRARPALWAGGRTLDYSALADAIARVSGLLLELGLRRGERVALLAGRTADAAAGVLGVMAAGGAPADPKTATFTIQLSGGRRGLPDRPRDLWWPGHRHRHHHDRPQRPEPVLCDHHPERGPAAAGRPHPCGARRAGRPRWWSRCSPRAPAESRFVLIIRGRAECAGRAVPGPAAGRPGDPGAGGRRVAGDRQRYRPWCGLALHDRGRPIKLRDLLPVFRTDKLLV